MDILSHGLWTNVVFLKARRRDRWWAVAFALLPDLIPFGPFFFEELAVHGIHDGPPTFEPRALAWITTTYPLTHSLVVFSAVFFITAFLHAWFRTPHTTGQPGKFEARNSKFETNSKGQKFKTSDFGLRISSFPLRPWWALGAWGLHILTDIPTHRRAFFPTPFLWPFSNYAVDAISWADPRFLYPNLLALVVVYLVIGVRWVLQRPRRT